MTAPNTQARQAASNAAEEIRALNHALHHYTGLAEIYAVTAEVVVLLQRLPQTLNALAAHTARLNDAGFLAIDPDTRYTDDPAGAVAAYTTALQQAAGLLCVNEPHGQLAVTAAGLVEQAQQVIGRAYQTEPASH
jgi:hypothetical protein